MRYVRFNVQPQASCVFIISPEDAMGSHLGTKFPVFAVTYDWFKKIASFAVAFILAAYASTSRCCDVDTNASMVITICIIGEVVTKNKTKFTKAIACKACAFAAAFRADFAAAE